MLGGNSAYKLMAGLSMGQYLEEMTLALNDDYLYPASLFRCCREFESGGYERLLRRKTLLIWGKCLMKTGEWFTDRLKKS